jgi:hypothetical protein
MTLIPFILLALLVHFWGSSVNRKKARKWMAVHQPILENEFSLVGYHQTPKTSPFSETSGDNLLVSANQRDGKDLPSDLLKEQAAYEYQTYASGRANTAFLDAKILLHRRMNPAQMIAEQIVGMFFDSIKPPREHFEVVLYTFDGNEKAFVPPRVPGAEEVDKVKGSGNSTYDGFVFAIVNKLAMRKFRDERYDASLTFTKDNAKLPDWATVMSESAEITETMLSKDLLTALEKAGSDTFEYLIITDQPTDKPTTLDETKPKKRLHLSLLLPSNGDYAATLPLFQQFLRLPDYLVANAHFRPEVMRKVNSAREAEKAKLKKVSEKEAEEERALKLEKMKKEERERKLKGLSAEEQRKFLEREAEKNRKRQEKKMTRRG